MPKGQRKSSQYRNTTQKEMIFELWHTMVGDTKDEGFINEMKAFKKDTQDRFDRLEKDIRHTKAEVTPVVNVVSNWRVVTAFVVMFVGLVSTIVYITVSVTGG